MNSIIFINLVCICSAFLPFATKKDCGKAVDLFENGNTLLSPYMDDNEKRVYADDAEYINAFPTFSYLITKVPGQGLFYLDQVDDYIKNVLRIHKRWESHLQVLMKKYITSGSCALDIGAHIGIHSIAMSKYVGRYGFVYAFEPNPKIYRELCMNLVLNKCKNVMPLRGALGKEKGIVQVVSSLQENEGGHFVIKSDTGENQALMLPLDAFQLEGISFIKIDVENMETEVLEGGKETLLSNRPILLIEIQGNIQRPLILHEDSQKMKQECLDKLAELNYRVERIGETDDYLAIPFEKL